MVLRGSLYVGVYKYARPGSISDWIFVFAASTSTDEPAVITEDENNKEEIQEAIDSVEIQEVAEVVHLTNSYGSTPNYTRMNL